MNTVGHASDFEYETGTASQTIRAEPFMIAYVCPVCWRVHIPWGAPEGTMPPYCYGLPDGRRIHAE